jgi:hypothetical protein
MGLAWICERELREGLGGRPLHLPDGVVLSTDSSGKEWRTAVEVELTRKTEVRVAASSDISSPAMTTSCTG